MASTDTADSTRQADAAKFLVQDALLAILTDKTTTVREAVSRDRLIKRLQFRGTRGAMTSEQVKQHLAIWSVAKLPPEYFETLVEDIQNVGARYRLVSPSELGHLAFADYEAGSWPASFTLPDIARWRLGAHDLLYLAASTAAFTATDAFAQLAEGKPVATADLFATR